MSSIIEKIIPTRRGNGNGQTGIAVSLLTITPEIAEELLKLNSNNRNLNKRMVASYAAMMKRGEWMAAQADICLNEHGVLVNGQHCLTAVVKSGATIIVTLKTNMPEAAQDTMDSHRKRRVGEQLKIDGFPNANVIAASSSVYLQWIQGATPTLGSGSHATSARFGHSADRLELLEFCRGNRQRLEANTALAYSRFRRERLMTHSQLAALQLYFDDLAPEHAAEFFAQLYGESEQMTAQPIAAYQAALRRRNGTREEWSASMKTIFAFKTFNAFMARQEIKQFKLRPGEQVTVKVPEGVN